MASEQADAEMEGDSVKQHGADITAKAEHNFEKLVGKVDDHRQEKLRDEKKPPGGFDSTPVPSAPPGYTVKFTFHRALNLPISDLNKLSSDPYIRAELKTNLRPRHKEDPRMIFRTPTVHSSVEPVWNSEWIVANIPASGFALKVRLYDEDPGDYDDRLGNVHIDVDGLSEGWQGIKEQSFKIKKRMGSKRAYLLRGCAAMLRSGVKMSGDVIASVELLGKTDASNGGRLWTVGPCNWTKHFSPMIGRIAGTKESSEDGQKGQDGKKATTKYNFQANEIQLAGPVPPELYHRYVEFRPIVKGMYTGKSVFGFLLHHAIHHQHTRIYNYDRHTMYGSFPAPSRDMALQFLDMVHYDQGARIFTYCLSLDGLWRFTETGKEFGIDHLSKHTMHSDMEFYIAYSGEFFIRRLQSPHKPAAPDEQPTHPPVDIEHGPPDEEPPKDPAYYSLIIDNDSGTYRPNAEMLPQLKKFLEQNLPGMHIITLDCRGDAEKMNQWKEEQRERKKKEGTGLIAVQGDAGDIGSSDEEDLEDQERILRGEGKKSRKEKAHGKIGKSTKKAKGIRDGENGHEESETRDDLAGGSQ